MSDDLYAVLGVARDATAAAIKAAWRKCAQEAHPDRAGGSAERMSAVNAAYRILGNKRRRAAYDATGKTGRDETQDNAEHVLRNEFRKALTSSKDEDLVSVVRHAVYGILENAKNARLNTEAQIATLRRRKSRLKEPTDGLFGVIIDDHIREAEAGLQTIDEARAAGELALKLLADYSWLASFADPLSMALLGGQAGMNQALGYSQTNWRGY